MKILRVTCSTGIAERVITFHVRYITSSAGFLSHHTLSFRPSRPGLSGERSSRGEGMATALHVSHVAKGFGGVPVLRDISFDLHPGELTVLAGENGAGKSTLMKIITGLLKADAGDGTVDGKPLEHVDPQHARGLGVGIVPQELAPYPDLTV